MYCGERGSVSHQDHNAEETRRYLAAGGKEWNKGANYAQGWSAVIWACRKVKGLKFTRTYEVSFANANGTVVTPESCRDLGRDTAKVFKEMLGKEKITH